MTLYFQTKCQRIKNEKMSFSNSGYKIKSCQKLSDAEIFSPLPSPLLKRGNKNENKLNPARTCWQIGQQHFIFVLIIKLSLWNTLDLI